MSETEKQELRKQAKDLKEARLKRKIRLERRKVRPTVFETTEFAVFFLRK